MTSDCEQKQEVTYWQPNNSAALSSVDQTSAIRCPRRGQSAKAGLLLFIMDDYPAPGHGAFSHPHPLSGVCYLPPRTKKATVNRNSSTTLGVRAEETGIAYQNLINLYLTDCAVHSKNINIVWK